MTAQLNSGTRVDVLRAMDLGIESLMDGHTTMWTAHDLMVMRAAVAELVEAAADFKAKTLPPGSDDYSANDAAEYAVAFRRFSAALARIGGEA